MLLSTFWQLVCTIASSSVKSCFQVTVFGYSDFRQICLVPAIKSLKSDLITPAQNTNATFPHDLIYNISFTSFFLQCINWIFLLNRR